MRVILDTNVLLAAMMAPAGPPDQLINAFLDDDFVLLSSEEQLEELARVSRYSTIRRRIKPSQVGSLVNDIRELSVIVRRLPRVSVSRDPDDNFLLAMAQAGEADYLVTGDKRDLLNIKRHGKTRIVTVRQMVKILKL